MLKAVMMLLYICDSSSSHSLNRAVLKTRQSFTRIHKVSDSAAPFKDDSDLKRLQTLAQDCFKILIVKPNKLTHPESWQE